MPTLRQSGATRLTCVPTNFAASIAEALTRQPTKAAHNNVCALSQTESGLGPLSHTRKPLKRAHVEVEERKKPLQPIAETAPHDPFWREEPAVSKTFEPPKRSYADAAGNKVQTCVPAILKKPTVLAARALKTKAKKNPNSNEHRKAPPQQTGANN